MAALGLVAVLAFLLLADGGQRVMRWLAPLNSYQVALIELNTASRGDGPDGQEYVVFLHDGAGPEVLAPFFRDHPSIRFVSSGLIPGIAVVHIRDDIPAALAALRTQPSVRLALKSRLGMVCH